MTLKQLEAFYWAATCQNFSVAAERLHLSVSSLSKRISELEQALNVALFDRSGRGASLTADGERLMPMTLDLLRQAAALQQSVGTAVGLHGRCRIGMGELSGMSWLADFVRECGARHPALVIEPQIDLGQNLAQQIQDGAIDVAVVASKPMLQYLAWEPVCELEFVWVAGKQQSSCIGSVEAIIDKACLVSMPFGAGSTRLSDEWLNDRKVHPRSVLTCNNWGAVVNIVVNSLGISVMPAEWAGALAAKGQVKILKSQKPLMALTYYLLWRHDDTRPLISEARAMVKSSVNFRAPSSL